MKKIIIFVLLGISWIIFLLNISYSDENTCNYTSKIEQCVNETNKRYIEEFVCIEGTKEEIIFQIVLDDKFTEIDEEVDIYLTQLELDKDKYFGPNADSNYIIASDTIEQKFAIWWEYWWKYNTFCWVDLIQEVQNCQDWEVSNIVASGYFRKSTCMNLATLKLNIYRQVAYDILMFNKESVREDLAKDYTQKQRTKYSELMQIIRINVWYMERISKKWPSKLKNTH